MSDTYAKVTRKTKPEWLKIRLHEGMGFARTAGVVAGAGLHTICTSGMCPNKAECWSRRTATLMILGDVCTRKCKFCATATGHPLPPDTNEPQRVAESVRAMGLRHAVLTSVTRDDLPDGGAALWAETVRAVRRLNPGATVEILIPDFHARHDLLDVVLDAAPDIAGHNIETVRRLTPLVRSGAQYELSLEVLRYMASRGATVKSGLMLGLGERPGEVLDALRDLHAAGCRIVTLGQYLQPTRAHLPVADYIEPAAFDRYRSEALEMGFSYVASGPLVRSSYLADKALEACGIRKE